MGLKKDLLGLHTQRSRLYHLRRRHTRCLLNQPSPPDKDGEAIGLVRPWCTRVSLLVLK